ncbi:hypothetical protein D3C81_1580140 [compost metagenome]
MMPLVFSSLLSCPLAQSISRSRSAAFAAPSRLALMALLPVLKSVSAMQLAKVGEQVRTVRVVLARRTKAWAPFSTILPSGVFDLSESGTVRQAPCGRNAQ